MLRCLSLRRQMFLLSQTAAAVFDIYVVFYFILFYFTRLFYSFSVPGKGFFPPASLNVLLKGN